MSKRLRRKPVALAALLAAAAVASLGAGPALAGERREAAVVNDASVSVSEMDAMERQRPLVAAANIVERYVEAQGLTQYAGIVLRDAHVDVYWKGVVPAAVRAVLRQAAETAPVQVHRAAYSNAELRAAARKLEAGWQGDRADLYAIKLIPGGAGLEIATPANRRTSIPDVGVPVTYVAGGPVEKLSRKDDNVPWAGGAQIYNGSRGGSCSSGFGVVNSSGSQYILTAEHCGEHNDSYYNGTGRRFIGYLAVRHVDHDIALIPTSRVSNTIYSGGVNSNDRRRVVGWDNVFINQLVCHSGWPMARERGGPLCNIKVERFRQDAGEEIEARQMGGITAAYSGDSGGPVYSLCCGGVNALGVVTGTVRGADHILIFQDFITARRDFGNIVPKT
ncbi:hypothetical protein HPO96_05405 [Kribbella sandramycini]|uniref:Peptidase S1 domain-containing protein n=1 Tax=Kribbella sandramycini TaxID=60450 RepID=A0A7Y4NXA4_9ACTN|nr:trypsin-like serine protease [Kribbella sandramycini]MBB6567726.1 hypothetical protein [Kribbella sandramycini]NOL39677.1 hypothetical protein [Kribbella sandramycini]